MGPNQSFQSCCVSRHTYSHILFLATLPRLSRLTCHCELNTTPLLDDGSVPQSLQVSRLWGSSLKTCHHVIYNLRGLLWRPAPYSNPYAIDLPRTLQNGNIPRRQSSHCHWRRLRSVTTELHDVEVANSILGINLAFARLLLRNQCNVLFADLALRPEAKEVVDAYSSSSRSSARAVFQETDVREWPQLERMFIAASKEFGGVDIVCPGAGVYEPVSSPVPRLLSEHSPYASNTLLTHGARAAILLFLAPTRRLALRPRLPRFFSLCLPRHQPPPSNPHDSARNRALSLSPTAIFLHLPRSYVQHHPRFLDSRASLPLARPSL